MHIAAWIAHEANAAPVHMADSIRVLQQAFADHISSNTQAVTDICRKMVYSLLMLRSEH